MMASDVAMSTIVRFAVCDARLAHDADAVRHGLDAGVGAAAQRVGAHEELQRPEQPERAQRAADVGVHLGGDRGQLRHVRADRDQQQDRVGDQEDAEDRRDAR